MTTSAAGTRALLGVVLGGGASSRFGSPKWKALLAGRPMAAWPVDALAPNTAKVVAVAGDPAFGELGVEVRSDEVGGRGPLEGIRTGLLWARELSFAGVFALACDLPLIRAPLVRALIASWRDEDAVAPFTPAGPEPLCALYGSSCLPVIDALLRGEPASPRELLARVRVHRFAIDETKTFGGTRDPFLNVNTPEQLAAAEAELLRLSD